MQSNNKKILDNSHLNNRTKTSSKVKTLRGDFIKIETHDKRYRPFYQEVKKWPRLNLTARFTHSPFESDSDRGLESQKTKFGKFSKLDSRTNTTSKFKTVGTIMTRKSRPTQQQNQGGTAADTGTTTVGRVTFSRTGSDNKQCGYCEICHVEYDVLKVHLKSEGHINYVKNDDNFETLDKLIESGASVQKFLKLNETNKKELILNGMSKKSSNKKLTNGGTDESSADDFERNGINGSSEEDLEENDRIGSPRPKRKCLQSPVPPMSPKSKKESHTVRSNDDPIVDPKILATRIRGLRWKAPSPDSRPPVKEPPVYKISKESPKQNSSSSRGSKLMSVDTGKQVVVKLKRVRQSELNLLNNEAEQFMFPKTPTYTDSDTDDDRPSTDMNRTNNTTLELASSDKECRNRSSTTKNRNKKTLTIQKKNSTPSSNIKRSNKRLDNLIEENCKYTQESLGRLRFQEAPIQPHATIESTHSDDRMGDNSFFKSPNSMSTQSRWINFKKKYQSLDASHKFNFERVPFNEPWYVTFQRQDTGFEHVYEYFGNSTYCKLPYELGPLPPAKEDCCKLDELIPPRDKCGTPNRKRGGSCAYPRMPSIAKVTDRTRSSTAAIIEATKIAEAIDDTTNDSTKSKSYLPLKKRKLFLEEVPRKSPREHASTLAILSSMKEGSSAPSSLSGVPRVTRRERLASQLSLDDDDNSNSTITSQQTNKTAATEKDNSSVYSNSIPINNPIQANYVNLVKLCQQVEEMLEETSISNNDDDLFKLEVDDFGLNEVVKQEEAIISSNIGSLSEILDVCSMEELTLRSVATKEKEVRRKITYDSKPKLITSGFRFNKKRKNNRTGWPLKRKLSLTKDKDDENGFDNLESSTTPINDSLKDEIANDILAVSCDSSDTHVVQYMKEDKDSSNANDTENDTAEEDTKPVMKSPVRTPRPNVYSRGAGKYQFEKFPKVNLTPLPMSNMKTRSSDLQKRKSITPKKYTDTPNESARSPISSPNKFSPRKLRKPRGRWYRER